MAQSWQVYHALLAELLLSLRLLAELSAEHLHGPTSYEGYKQHLVDSFPEDVLTKTIPEVDRFKQSEPRYPTYT
jgi:hypothetical protein